MNKNEFLLISLFVIVIIFTFFRFSGLGKTVTADEPRWILRSARFAKNIRDLSLGDTIFTVKEPTSNQTFAVQGLITRWVVGGPLLFSKNFSVNPKILFTDNNLLIAQTAIAMATLFLITISSLLTIKLFQSRIFGIILFLMLYMDGFLLSLSRVVHVDGILSLLMIISALSMLISFKYLEKKYIVLSGITAGMAMVQKGPALFLLAFFLLVAVLYALKRNIVASTDPASHKQRRAMVLLSGMWFCTLIIGVFFFYPAMLVKPMETIAMYFAGTLSYVRAPNYLSITQNAKGLMLNLIEAFSFYTVILGIKINLLIYIGLMILVYSIKNVSQWQKHIKNNFLELSLILVYAIFFQLQMSLGTSLVGRYILPAHISWILLGSYGLYILIKTLLKKKSILICISIILGMSLQGLDTLRFHPDYLAYKNPLFSARYYDMYDYGWGTGLIQAMDYIYDDMDNNSIIYTHYPWVPYFRNIRSQKKAHFADLQKHTCGENNAKYLLIHTPLMNAYETNPTLVEFLKTNLYKPIKTIKRKGLGYVDIYIMDNDLNIFFKRRCEKGNLL